MKNKKIVLIILTVLYFVLIGTASAEIGVPVKIETASDFKSIRDNLNENYILANNIVLDFSDEELKNWEPVGTYDHPFTGKFDGNNKTITIVGDSEGIENSVVFVVSKSSNGLDKSEFDGHGLFGNVKSNGENSGIIENLTVIVQCHLSNGGSDHPTGVLVGYLGAAETDETAVVRNCFVYPAGFSDAGGSDDSFFLEGKYKSGGLAGVVNNGLVEDSGAGINVCSSKSSAGGLIGYIFSGTVTACYSDGDVFTDADNAGGLIGEIESALISQCYASGDILAEKNAGGLIGYVSGNSSIENTYAEGGVFATGKNAGGLVGFVAKYKTLALLNSYA